MKQFTELQIESLSLTDFRCFEHCSVSLHPKLTVLVAENGQGKSAILDAIRISLSAFIDTLSQTQQFGGPTSADVRLVPETSGTMLPAEEMRITASGKIVAQDMQWSLTQKGASVRSSTRTNAMARLLGEAQKLHERIAGSMESDDNNTELLPLVAYYGANRIWSTQPTKLNSQQRKMIGRGRLEGYAKCFSAAASFADANAWYISCIEAVRNPTSRFLPEYSRPEKQLVCAGAAMRTVLEPTGWADLGWNFGIQKLTAMHPEFGSLPVELLSDGIRNTIALAVDIARRCATLNPHLGEEAAEKTPGILLIDEVDLHLHPSWQQQVVDLLQKAFPSLQIVLTTHSPHVLSAVKVESIRTISVHDQRGTVVTPTTQTRGTRSGDILARIMNVDPIPPVEEAEWLSEYRALLEQGLVGEEVAQMLRRNLEAHFGPNHYVLMELDSIQRVNKFKESLRTRPK